jgi:hypothetical protein
MNPPTRPPLILAGLVLLACTLSANEARAQFRNMGVQLPNVGWMAFDTTLGDVNRSLATEWGATDQLTLGAGYMWAIGYRTWWDNQVALGFGGAANIGVNAKTIVTANISTGLRHVFLDDIHRPYIAGHLHYLHFFNIEGTNVLGNPALGNQALWVGFRPEGGYEFYFAEEMSITAALGYLIFVNLDQPFKHSAIFRLAYSVYF